MKKCSKCDHSKPDLAFSRDAKAADGLRSDCKECCRKSNAEWRRKNPEKAKANINKWRSENVDRARELRRESAKRAYAKNPEKHRQRSRKWASENKESRAEKQGRRRAKGECAWADKAKIKEIYAFAKEFRDAGIDVEVDHIMPLQGEYVCGLHVETNLRVCLTNVNRQKRNRVLEYFE